MHTDGHRRVARSMEIYQHAVERIPGGTQLISRRPSRFAYGVSPIYAERAKGAHLWDVDGNEYVDWVSGILAIILGYADEVVDGAVIEQIRKGSIYSINHELEVELAEELIATIPSAEMVRYAKGGGDACAMAVRIARGVTGRDRVLFCGYHGWHDWYIAANLARGESLDEHLFPGIEPIGVPAALKGTALPFRYGDLDLLGHLLEKYRGEVACIIMEPMRSELPPEGFLEGVRELADQHGVILIFDEVSCGFRPAIGGAQELLGVTPDMTALAKAMSNGYAMGAVVGKRAVMEPAGRMFISSSYWSDTIGLAATLTTIRELKRRNGPAHFARIGRSLHEKLQAAMARVGLSATCEGIDYAPSIHWNLRDPQTERKVTTLFIQEMAKRGILAYAHLNVNCSHTDQDVEQTVQAAEETFGIIREGLEQDTLDDLLEATLQEDLFRRLVT